jgi:hypothetical protein
LSRLWLATNRITARLVQDPQYPLLEEPSLNVNE